MLSLLVSHCENLSVCSTRIASSQPHAWSADTEIRQNEGCFNIVHWNSRSWWSWTRVLMLDCGAGGARSAAQDKQETPALLYLQRLNKHCWRHVCWRKTCQCESLSGIKHFLLESVATGWRRPLMCWPTADVTRRWPGPRLTSPINGLAYGWRRPSMVWPTADVAHRWPGPRLRYHPSIDWWTCRLFSVLCDDSLLTHH